MVVEHLTGYTRSEMLVRGDLALAGDLSAQFDRWQEELLAWRPVQYVLGEAWFSGMRFRVDERVLIPRPETEELVEWIGRKLNLETGKWNPASRTRGTGAEEQPAIDILDIGTGSGCIAIALKKRLSDAVVMAIDKSTGALQLARENAQILGADLRFAEIDILNPHQAASLGPCRVIVSNPPYVPISGIADMRPNVRQYEPHLALFVANEDPLVFFRTIAALGKRILEPGGLVFFEIHAGTGQSVQDLLVSQGYVDVELKQDLGGLERMVAAVRP